MVDIVGGATGAVVLGVGVGAYKLGGKVERAAAAPAAQELFRQSFGPDRLISGVSSRLTQQHGPLAGNVVGRLLRSNPETAAAFVKASSDIERVAVAAVSRPLKIGGGIIGAIGGFMLLTAII